jgi:hypothetical protein
VVWLLKDLSLSISGESGEKLFDCWVSIDNGEDDINVTWSDSSIGLEGIGEISGTELLKKKFF